MRSHVFRFLAASRPPRGIVRRRRSQRTLRVEPLEQRQLLAADLAITEFMASNGGVLLDEDGNTSDWIEIHNASPAPIDLADWSLTDDAGRLDKWTFPSQVLDAGQYLVVFASAADRATAAGELHTNFKLKSGGEYVALVSPAGEVVSEFGSAGADYPPQFEDISYGSAAAGPRYFDQPTPGAANGQGQLGLVADTSFSVDRGFFEAPFQVVISTRTADAEIRYTTDGSVPTQVTGSVYSGPIPIDTTTVLRAAAFKPQFIPTNVDTQTYFFLADVVRQPVSPEGLPSTWGTDPADYGMDPEIVDDPAYAGVIGDGLKAIPSLSITLDQDELFGPDGIYSNTLLSGMAWERAASAELIFADGSDGFQVDAGLRVQGGASRDPSNSPKHAFSLRFRDTYGAGQLEFPLFAGSAVERFDSLHLRAAYNNSWISGRGSERARAAYIRDQWVRDSLLAMGEESAGQGMFVHLYLNGLYWGVYNLHERPVASHYAAWFGGDEDDYDAANGSRFVDGDATSWNHMKSVVASGDWQAIQQVLDVDAYIDWTIIQRYGSNNDLQAGGNWRAAGGGPNNAPWVIYAWDTERVLEGAFEGGPNPTADPPGLLEDLTRVPEFVVRFGDRVQKHLFNDGALTPAAAAARWEARANQLELAVIAESARWGDWQKDRAERYTDVYTKADYWDVERARLLTRYFPVRGGLVVNQYKKRGLFPKVEAPRFDPFGGAVPAGFPLSIENSNDQSAIYLAVDGSDPRAGPETVDLATLLATGASVRVLVPTDNSLGASWIEPGFDDSGWTGGATGVGYGSTSGFAELVGLDMESAMLGQNATAFMRLPFQVADPAAFDRLFLRMKYDDGFVVYLNGVEVARRNAPAQPTWKSAATLFHANAEAVEFEKINITPFLDLLRAGDNVLAIHGLNSFSQDKDFLIVPELDGGVVTDSGISPSAVRYTGPVTISAETVVKARALKDGDWSALTDVRFTLLPSSATQGDLDRDGDVDFDDIDDLVLALTDPPAYVARYAVSPLLGGDLNHDGMVDWDDIEEFVALFMRRR